MDSAARAAARDRRNARRHLTRALWCVVAFAAVGSSPVNAEVGTYLGDGSTDRAASATAERVQRMRAALQPEGPALVQLERLERRGAPASLSLLVVGCDFSDSLMVGRDREQFEGWPAPRRTAQPIPLTDIPMFAAHDAAYFDLQMQRVDDYFRTVSFGRFSLQWDVHPTIVNLPRPMGYYGSSDSATVRAVRMAREVIDAIDDDVDFSQYDTLVLIHAGAGRETDINGDSPEQIFSNYLDRRDFEIAVEAGVLAEPVLRTGEIDVEHVLVLPEAQAQDPPPGNPRGGFFDVRGVYCFEIGLRLGMLSLADFTPSGNPDSQGIGNFGLMGYGLFVGLSIVPSAPSAMNRWLMGWVDAVDVLEDADVRIGAMGAAGAAVSDTLLVRVPIHDREYWLLEYRLQDPDGDLFYTFDDLNGNGLPDYFDADSAVGDGRPTSAFDPATDTWEREIGAEFDWFMSENPARTPDRCQRAGGSGLYVWHIDERVIEDALFAGTNTINADADRKGVDLEEADGIQDLDRPTLSPYLLGSDRDAWRGEGSAEFGPTTLPSTSTNDGVPTGIRFAQISHVIADSLPRNESGNCTGFVYRPAMNLRVEFGATDAEGPRERARVRTNERAPVADVRLADLGTSAGDPTPDGRLEIVVVTDGGGIDVWRDDLTEWNDGDGDPATQGPFSTIRPESGWNGAAAVADVDGNGEVEILLASADALYVLRPDGATRFSLDDPADGPAVRAESGERFVGPVVVASTGGRAAVLAVTGDAVRIVEVEFADGLSVRRSVDLAGSATVGATPLGPDLEGWVLPHVRTGGGFALATLRADAAAWEHVVTLPDSAVTSPTVFGGDLPLAYVWTESSGRVRAFSTESGTQRATLGAELPAARASAAPRARADVGVGVAPVVALAQAGALSVQDAGLRELVGFPYRPARGGRPSSIGPRAAAPILVDLDGDGHVEVVWHEPAGALHAVDLQGRSLRGWPVAGPAEPASSPAVGDLDGDGRLELVVAGRFERGAGTSAMPEISGEIRIFEIGEVPASAYAPWPQGGAGPLNLSGVPGSARSDAGGDLLDSTFVVRPNPAHGDFVRVRVEVGRTRTVRAGLYTVEGQLVTQTGSVTTLGGTVFEEDLSLAGVRAGLYVCRVDDGERSLVRVLTVVR